MRNSSRAIIDTNVLMLASGDVELADVARLKCANKCAEFIRDFIEKPLNIVVVDNDWEIITEYRNNIATLKNGGGLAEAFLQKILHAICTSSVELIPLDKIGEYNYSNYPNNIRLQTFDKDDRKFIALSYSHPQHPPIVQGGDSEWYGIKQDLLDEQIQIIFLDEDYCRDIYMRKYL